MDSLTKHPFIIDSDTGSDDCMAILLAGAYARERCVLLISTYGNYSLETTTDNLRTSAALARLDCPILTGAAGPMPVLDSDTAEPTPHIITDGTRFTDFCTSFPYGPVAYECGDPLEVLCATLCHHAPCDYIAIGPLTNLALLLRRFPEVRKYIGEVVIMGGGFEYSNVTPYSEFNIYCDALAAREVFSSGLPIRMAALDVCFPTALPQSVLERIRSIDGSFGACMNALLEIDANLSDSFGNPRGIIYDAVAVCGYLCPELFRIRKTGAFVVSSGKEYARTVENYTLQNVTFLESVDMDGYLSFLWNGLTRLTE